MTRLPDYPITQFRDAAYSSLSASVGSSRRLATPARSWPASRPRYERRRRHRQRQRIARLQSEQQRAGPACGRHRRDETANHQPDASSGTPRASPSRRPSPRSAPSAIRMPISLRRRSTMYDITPYSPIVASSAAEQAEESRQRGHQPLAQQRIASPSSSASSGTGEIDGWTGATAPLTSRR